MFVYIFLNGRYYRFTSLFQLTNLMDDFDFGMMCYCMCACRELGRQAGNHLKTLSNYNKFVIELNVYAQYKYLLSCACKRCVRIQYSVCNKRGENNLPKTKPINGMRN